MKNLILTILVTVFTGVGLNLKAQDSAGKKTIEIKTSAQCGMCNCYVQSYLRYEENKP